MGTVWTNRVSLTVKAETETLPLGIAATSTRREMVFPEPRSVRFAAQPEPACFSVPPIPLKQPTMKQSVDRPKLVTAPVRRTALPGTGIATRRIKIVPVNRTFRSRKIVFERWDRSNTYRWDHIRNMPVTRDALNLARVPYPMISEFISTLADKHHVLYTDVRLLGVFDHIPMHYATTLSIDTLMGRLRFYMRETPRGDKKFMRVVYGKIRSTGEMVQAFFPLV